MTTHSNVNASVPWPVVGKRPIRRLAFDPCMLPVARFSDGRPQWLHAADLRLYGHDILDSIAQIESVEDLCQWTFDAQKAGTLSKAISSSGVKTEYHYDNLARLDETTWTVNGELFKVSTTYDALDRVDTVAYPEVAGFGRTTIRQRYNAFGALERIEDVSPGGPGQTIWVVKARNRDGQMLTRLTGDGAVTRNAYNEYSGQVEGIHVQSANGDDLYHVGMMYDDAGRMVTRTDSARQREETFRHDELSRLTTWTLQSANATQSTMYQYDRLSSLEKVTRNGVIEQNYTHGNNGRPHAIVDDGQPLGFYTYDARGRVVHGGGRSITYTDFDLPANVTTNSGTTTFAYDAANQRVVNTSLDEQTIYIGGLYERRESALGMVHVFHVAGIADIVMDPKALIPRETLYLHGDALGSTSLITDAQAKERERLYYAPFGARVDIDGNPTTGPPGQVRDGFTGHRHDDELGLIDMRGRVFDTKTSRFPTPDPVVADPMFSPSLNRFAYVEQSPLQWVDPTGFEPERARYGEWFASVNAPGVNLAPPANIGGNVDAGLLHDVAAGVAGMHFPAGSDAVNTSGCPKGTGKTPRPCAGASQAGCPSGNTQADSLSVTHSWGARFTEGMAKEYATSVVVTHVRMELAFGTVGVSEVAYYVGKRGIAAYEGYQREGVGGAIADAVNVGNPLYQLGEMGARLYHAADVGNPEEIGAATLPVAATVVGVVVGGSVAGGARAIPEHHIATVRNGSSSARGGPWTPRFREIFDNAGMSMEDAANRVHVPGHKGPHPQAYHERIFRRLYDVTDGLSGTAAESALRAELGNLRADIQLS